MALSVVLSIEFIDPSQVPSDSSPSDLGRCQPTAPGTAKPLMAVVTDAETGQPISSASVCLVAGFISKTGVQGGSADEHGRIMLDCPENLQSGLFSACGYTSKLVGLG